MLKHRLVSDGVLVGNVIWLFECPSCPQVQFWLWWSSDHASMGPVSILVPQVLPGWDLCSPSQHQTQQFGLLEAGSCYRIANLPPVRQSQARRSQGTVCLNYACVKPNEKFCTLLTDFKTHKQGQISETGWDWSVAPELGLDKSVLWFWSGAVTSEEEEVTMCWSWKPWPMYYCGKLQLVWGVLCMLEHVSCMGFLPVH